MYVPKFTREKTIEELERLLKMVNGANLIPELLVTATIERLKKLQAQVKELEEENKKLKGTCACMDCGKIIKTVEQSKHNRECEKKHTLECEPKDKETK